MQFYVLAFILVCQPFFACQQGEENGQALTAKTVFAAQHGQEKPGLAASQIIFQSADGGQTWQDVSAGLPGDLPVNCFKALNGEVLLGSDKGLYRSQITSAAPVWQKEFLLAARIEGVYSGRAGAYALSPGNGFFQNIAPGVWMPVFAVLKEQSLRTLFESADGSIFVGCDRGIFKSADHGKTWKHVYENGWMIRIVESNGVLLCTSEEGILRSSDGGEHWDVVISEGGVGIEVDVIQGGFAAITYNTESKTRRIRISEDGGKTWQAIDAGLPPDANIASIKQVGEYFFCGHPAGIFRSADRGKTWELVLPTIEKKVFNLSVSGNLIFALPRNGGC